MPHVVGFIFLVAAGLLVWVLLSGERTVRERVQTLSSKEGLVPRSVLLERSFGERILYPAIRVLAKAGARLTPASQRKKAQLRLQQAGLKGEGAMQAMLAARGLGLVAGALAGWGIAMVQPRAGLIAGGIIMLIGVLGPDMWLKAQIAKRQDAIIRSLPDVLDLVTAGTEAGLSFDAAVQRISARPGESDRVLKEELGRYLADVRLGQARSEALMDLGRRCGVDDMKGLVAALLQADQLGVGVGSILRAQSQHLRTRRRQRAQEAAMKAPIKMLFPLVFFIFPAMFVVILGPAALRLIDQFVTGA